MFYVHFATRGAPLTRIHVRSSAAWTGEQLTPETRAIHVRQTHAPTSHPAPRQPTHQASESAQRQEKLLRWGRTRPGHRMSRPVHLIGIPNDIVSYHVKSLDVGRRVAENESRAVRDGSRRKRNRSSGLCAAPARRGSESRVGYLRPQGYIKIVKYSHFKHDMC